MLEGVDAVVLTTVSISSKTDLSHQVTAHVEGVVAGGAFRLPSPVLIGREHRLPGDGMQKSTTMVVPPDSAALVPLSKSSAVTVPMNGNSRWVCGSMPPGMT